MEYERRCPTCDVEVSQEEIVRGYEYQKGQYVVLKDEDFEGITDERSKTIDIMDFVDLTEIDPIYFEKSYSKETLVVLRVYQNALAMATIFYPDEIRSTAGMAGIQIEPKLHENEIRMANSLIKKKPPQRPKNVVAALKRVKEGSGFRLYSPT